MGGHTPLYKINRNAGSEGVGMEGGGATKKKAEFDYRFLLPLHIAM